MLPMTHTPRPIPTGTDTGRNRTTGPWWWDAVVYQVYPRSFADSDGDGIGDLPGVISRLPYLAALGVDAVWLSPFYASPHHDAGYDVADYRDVDPVFGTLDDADHLVTEAHRLGLRVVVDLVPNHTSSEHPWFRAALAARPGSPERDRYVFRDGRGRNGEQPPNSWLSVFGGPAWTRVDDQWYLHLFDVHQPDLNWENPEVATEFESVLRFWLDRGVDGFRVDVANGLVKAEGLPDWKGVHHLLDLDHGPRPPMWDQDGVHEIYRSWRRVLAEYPHDPILVAEAWVRPAERQARYVREDEMHQAFNFEYLFTPWRADRMRRIIREVLTANQAVGAPATWVLSNHDVVRHPTRFAYPAGTPVPNGIGSTDPQPDTALGLRRGRAASLLMLALPGSAYLFQGEELGLPEHTTLPDAARQDPTWTRSGHTQRGRDGARVPLPWVAGAPSVGFGPSTASWLPTPAGWDDYAVDRQDGVEGSTLETYRSALRLRRQRELGSGELIWVDDDPGPAGTGLLAFRNRDVLVLANVGGPPVPLPADAEVLLASDRLATAPGPVDDGSGPVDDGSGAPDPVQVLPPDTTVWLVTPTG
jgi:alpha-glucosidase